MTLCNSNIEFLKKCYVLDTQLSKLAFLYPHVLWITWLYNSTVDTGSKNKWSFSYTGDSFSRNRTE